MTGGGVSDEVNRDVPAEFPVIGDSLVVRPPGHGRWAFDVLPVGPGSGSVAAGGWWRYLAGRLRAADVAGWGRQVRSPLDGRVVASHDGVPDRQRLLPWRDVPAGLLVRPLLRGRDLAAMAGNHIVVGGEGRYALLAHLQQGSVRVHPGETVHAGQVLGLVGSSGNAIGPHLHLQLMAGPDPMVHRPVPFVVRRFQRWDGDRWHEQTGAPLPAGRARIRVR